MPAARGAPIIPGMHIVALAWLYVTVLMALTESNVVAGTLTLLFYGILPLALVLWLFGGPARRRQEHGNDSGH